MSKLFGNMGRSDHEEAKDTLGGYSVLDSNVYTGQIKQFYAGEAASGAKNITVILAGGDFGNTEYRETVYITNRKGENFYVKNDKKNTLPGYILMDDMALCAAEVELSDLVFEDKMVNIYDPEQKKELPKSVPVAIDLIGKTVSVAIQKNLESQTEKQGDEYVAKADGSTRETNSIDKVFNTEHRITVSEAKHGASENLFWDKWIEKNKGKVRDRTEKSDTKSGKPGSPPQAGGNSGGGSDGPRKSLFGNK